MKKLTNRDIMKLNLIDENIDICDLLMLVCGGICSKQHYLQLCNKLGVRRYGKVKNGKLKRGRVATKSNEDDIRVTLRKLARLDLLSEDYTFNNQKFITAKGFLYKHYSVPPICLRKDISFSKSLFMSEYLLSLQANNLDEMKQIIGSSSLMHRKQRLSVAAKTIGINQKVIDWLAQNNVFITSHSGFEAYKNLEQRIIECKNIRAKIVKLHQSRKIDDYTLRQYRSRLFNEYEDIYTFLDGVIPENLDNRTVSLIAFDVYADFDQNSIKWLSKKLRSTIQTSEQFGKKSSPLIALTIITHNPEFDGFKLKEYENMEVGCLVYSNINSSGKSKTDIIIHDAKQRLVNGEHYFG